ncbi:MAG: fumarylacetoacetate hydrolase family protein, partial [Actinomycetota bacterium]
MAFTFANHAGRAVLVDGNNFHDLEVLSGGTIPSDPAAALAHGDKLHDLQKRTADRTPEGTIDAAKLGAPSPTPQKVFGIGLNYKTHAAESNMEVPDNPVVFAKFSSCICAPNSNIELRSDRVDYEGEIVVIIGTPGKDISQADAWNHVFAITAGQDVSDRPVQMASKPPHFDLGKSRDTYGPLGPVLVSTGSFANPADLELTCHVNGEQRQHD